MTMHRPQSTLQLQEAARPTQTQPQRVPARVVPRDLNPAALPAGERAASSRDQTAPATAAGRPRGRAWKLLGAAAAALVAWAVLLAPSPPDGPSHPRYHHHIESPATEIIVGDEDIDRANTQAARTGNEATLASEPLVATLTPGARAEIRAGDARYYHIFLFDNCDEDGDIVQVYFNGALLGEVPITHAGTTISVPVTQGAAGLLQIVAVHDGQGGITVAFQTSAGRRYSRILQVGESQVVNVVAP